MSRWLEVVATAKNDAQMVVKFLEKNVLTRYDTLESIVNDEGTHFCNKIFAKLMTRYGIRHEKALAYHPQCNDQVEVLNRDQRRILE